MTATLRNHDEIARTEAAFDWRTNGLCDPGEADLHFVDVEELVDRGFTVEAAELLASGAESEAKIVCAACPVRSKCLASAMTNDEEWGVWGGMTRAERLAYRPAWAAIKKLPRAWSPQPSVQKNQDALHRNTGVNFRYRVRVEQAQQTIDRLMEQPSDWAVDTGQYCTPSYGTHCRAQLIDMFDMIKRYPERTAKELGDGFNRSANWFNTVTRAARRALGTD